MADITTTLPSSSNQVEKSTLPGNQPAKRKLIPGWQFNEGIGHFPRFDSESSLERPNPIAQVPNPVNDTLDKIEQSAITQVVTKDNRLDFQTPNNSVSFLNPIEAPVSSTNTQVSPQNSTSNDSTPGFGVSQIMDYVGEQVLQGAGATLNVIKDEVTEGVKGVAELGPMVVGTEIKPKSNNPSEDDQRKIDIILAGFRREIQEKTNNGQIQVGLSEDAKKAIRITGEHEVSQEKVARIHNNANYNKKHVNNLAGWFASLGVNIDMSKKAAEAENVAKSPSLQKGKPIVGSVLQQEGSTAGGKAVLSAVATAG